MMWLWLSFLACSSPGFWRPAVILDPSTLRQPMVDTADTGFDPDACVVTLDEAWMGISSVEADAGSFGSSAWDLLQGPFALGQASVEGETGEVTVKLGPVGERAPIIIGGNATDAEVAALNGDALHVAGTVRCEEEEVAFAWRDPPSTWRCPSLTVTPDWETTGRFVVDLPARLGELETLISLDADDDGVLDTGEWAPEPLTWNQNEEDCEEVL